MVVMCLQLLRSDRPKRKVIVGVSAPDVERCDARLNIIETNFFYDESLVVTGVFKGRRASLASGPPFLGPPLEVLRA